MNVVMAFEEHCLQTETSRWSCTEREGGRICRDVIDAFTTQQRSCFETVELSLPKEHEQLFLEAS